MSKAGWGSDRTATTDLARFVATAPMVDTHEHLEREASVVGHAPDVLFDLFRNYVLADLVVAGATQAATDRLIDATDRDVRARFLSVRDAWERCRFTGYGEAVRLIARDVYGMDEVTVEAIEAAQAEGETTAALRRPGARLEAFRRANIDHVQVDAFSWNCAPDEAAPEFFLYDLSWVQFSNGRIDVPAIRAEVGIEVRDVATLGQAMDAVFARFGPTTVAVKTQHAYDRTLLWRERDPGDVARVLARVLAGDETLTPDERCVLGDWCLARGVELAIRYDLPFKIHTGYYAGHSRMPVERIRPGNLCALLARYPKARFVLMHIGYPYQEELTALAKHYPNVWIDLCWAWSINPFAATDFVRRYLHAVPSNKLFAFGGDSFWPVASAAYALQARRGLARALEAEVADGLLTEAQALALAARFLKTNQYECFDVEGTRRAIRTARAAASTAAV